MEPGSEGVIVVGCIVAAALLWAWLNRPGAPDPETAPLTEVEREGYAGILGACLLAVIAIAAVLAL